MKGQNGGNSVAAITSPAEKRSISSGTPGPAGRDLRGEGHPQADPCERSRLDRGRRSRFSHGWQPGEGLGSGEQPAKPQANRALVRRSASISCSGRGRLARAQRSARRTDRGRHVRRSRACGGACRAAAAWGSSSGASNHSRIEGRLRGPVGDLLQLCALAPPQQWGQGSRAGACSCHGLGLQQPAMEAR